MSTYPDTRRLVRVRSRRRGVLSATAVGALLLSSQLADAVPLSQRPTTPGPHYFGYSLGGARRIGDPAGGCAAGDYTPCFDDHANVTQIEPGDIDFPNYCPAGQPYCDSKFMLDELRSRGMGAVFALAPPLLGNCTTGSDGHGHLGSGWTTFWNDYSQNVFSKYQDVIIAFDLADEPPTWDPPTMDCLGIAASQMRSAFPNIHRHVNFLAISLMFGANWTVPTGVDWISYDHYNPSPGNFIPGVPAGCAPVADPSVRSVPFYVGRLKALAERSHPLDPIGLVLFPVAWELGGPDTSFATQSCMLTRAEREIALAENDPDFVMIEPFQYPTGIDSLAPEFHTGVNGMPLVKAYYQGVGKHFTSRTYPTRPAFPSSMTASAFVPGGEVGNAFDGDYNTAWNAGNLPPPAQWIQAGFSDPIVMTNFWLVAAQTPAGYVEHDFSGTRVDGTQANFIPYMGQLADGQMLSSGNASVGGGLTSLRITTTQSPSWVAWRTFGIATTGTTRVYGYPTGAEDLSATNLAQNAIDLDPETAWTPGGPTPSVTLDLKQVQTLSRIEVIAYHGSPSRSVTHTLSTGSTSSNITARTSGVVSTDHGTLVFNGPFTNTRYVKLSIGSPPFTVGWRDISLYR